MWTEKDVTLNAIKVGQVFSDELDLSKEDFEIREVKSDCNCLVGGIKDNVLSYEIVGNPFPLHLEYKKSFETTSKFVLFTTKGRKIINFKYKMVK